jgi:hypothetical protein
VRRLLVLGLVIAACGGDDDGPVDRPDARPEIDAEPPPTSCDPAVRETRDRPDEAADDQIHVVYALPSDGVDRALDTGGDLAASVAAWNGWLDDAADGSHMRLDTCNGELDVTFVRLGKTDAEIAARGAFVRDEIEAQMRAAGLIADDKIYAVYYDGSSTYACGGGAWPPALSGQVGALYLHGAPPGFPTCDSIPLAGPGDPPGYHEFAMLHEIIHTLGMVAEAAPHHNLGGHVGDTPSDLMYAGPSPWDPSVLDLGHDDYFGHGQAWPDLARSAFLEPRPADAELPPGW